MSSILQLALAAAARVHADTTEMTPEEHELMRPMEQLNARKLELEAALAKIDEQGTAAMREVERQLALRHNIPPEQAQRVCVHWHPESRPYRWHLLPATIIEIPADGGPPKVHELAGSARPTAQPDWAKELAERIARGEES